MYKNMKQIYITKDFERYEKRKNLLSYAKILDALGKEPNTVNEAKNY